MCLHRWWFPRLDVCAAGFHQSPFYIHFNRMPDASSSRSQGIGVDCDGYNDNLLLRARLLVDGDLLHVVQHVLALQDLAKDGVLAVEVRGRGKGDEELAA